MKMVQQNTKLMLCLITFTLITALTCLSIHIFSIIVITVVTHTIYCYYKHCLTIPAVIWVADWFSYDNWMVNMTRCVDSQMRKYVVKHQLLKIHHHLLQCILAYPTPYELQILKRCQIRERIDR